MPSPNQVKMIIALEAMINEIKRGNLEVLEVDWNLESELRPTCVHSSERVYTGIRNLHIKTKRIKNETN